MNGLIQVIFSIKYYLGEFQRHNFRTNKRRKRNASFIRCYSGRKYPTCQFPHNYVCNSYVCANPYIWKVVSLTHAPTLLNKNAEDVNNPSWQLGSVMWTQVPHKKFPAVSVPRTVILSPIYSPHSSFFFQLSLDSEDNCLQLVGWFSTSNSMGKGLKAASK